MEIVPPNTPLRLSTIPLSPGIAFSFYDVWIDKKDIDMPMNPMHVAVAPKADTKLTSHITRVASKPREEAEGNHLVDYSRLG